MRRYTIYVCPECEEQTEDHDWSLIQGHYHDPPPDPKGEDLWVDAEPLEVTPTKDVEGLVEALREIAEDGFDLPLDFRGDPVGYYTHLAREALATFEEGQR